MEVNLGILSLYFHCQMAENDQLRMTISLPFPLQWLVGNVPYLLKEVSTHIYSHLAGPSTRFDSIGSWDWTKALGKSQIFHWRFANMSEGKERKKIM